MTSQSGNFDSVREWFSVRLYRIAYAVQPPERERGPRCLDCGIGPAEPDECEVCKAAWERDQMEKSIYEEGAEAGYREAEAKYGEPTF